MIDLHPTKCNLCGGKVIFTSNAKIYGKEYGSGKCYLCTSCGAHVGTHEPQPDVAYGLLSNSAMCKAKKKLHGVFDPYWKDAPKPRKTRTALYRWLSERMEIPVEECHFGFFDLEQLNHAYKILLCVKEKRMVIQKGKIRFVEEESV